MLRNLLAALLMVWAATPAVAETIIKKASLGYGVTAWYAPSEAVPVVDVLLVFQNAGAAQDPAGKEGLASFTTSMLSEGAGTLDAQSFARALDAKAITLDFRADDDSIVVHLYCLREHAEEAARLLALALGKPMLAAGEMARVKSQFSSLYSQLDESPDYQADKLLDATAFKGHPYANTLYGTPQTMAGLTAQDVRGLLAQRLTRHNVIVSASGAVDAPLLKTMLTPVIAALSDKPAPLPVPAPVMQGGGTTVRQRQDVPQTVITFVAPGINRSDKRFYTAYLLNEILGGGTLTSRLSNEVRQKKGLVYSVGTSLEVKDSISLISGQLASRNSSSEKALEAVKNLFAELREKGVTEEECVDAKSYVIGHFPLQLDRTSNVSGMLYTMQRYHLGENYLTERVAFFNEVSCNDINQLARELLAPEKFLFAVVGGISDTAAPPPTPPAPASTPAHGDAR